MGVLSVGRNKSLNFAETEQLNQIRKFFNVGRKFREGMKSDKTNGNENSM